MGLLACYTDNICLDVLLISFTPNYSDSCACWLQESIRNSADGVLLAAPDSLVVSITKIHGLNADEQPNTSTLSSTPRKSRSHSFGIDGLDLLKFTYKVFSSLVTFFSCNFLEFTDDIFSGLVTFFPCNLLWPL